MYIFIKNKARMSVFLLLLALLTISPLFVKKINAQAQQAADESTAVSICSSTAGWDAAALPIPGEAPGVDPNVVADYGVRYNTLQILCGTLGVTPGSVAYRQNVENSIYYLIGRVFLRQLTMSVVTWINSGFQGNPSFIQNPEKFLANDADQTVGAYLQSSDLNFLCEPFKINVKIALGLQYSPYNPVTCSLTDALKNSKDAYNNFVNGDFIGGGGWNSWLQITTVPQNNQMGALLLAQSQLDVSIANKSVLKNNELNWGNGFLSLKKCTRKTTDQDGNETSSSDYFGDPGFYQQNVGSTSTEMRSLTNADGSANGFVEEDCKITTPGNVLSNSLNKYVGLDTDALNMANDINEIVGALANFVITKAINTGISAISPNDLSPSNADWLNGIKEMQSVVTNSTKNGSASALDPSTYTSAATSNNGGVTYNGNNQLTNGTFDASKNALLANINAYTAQEQNYFTAFNTIYLDAATTTNKFTGVIACYNNVLSNTANLTTSEKAMASSSIATASSTITMIKYMVASSTPDRILSQINLTALQNILASTTAATSTDQLTTIQNNLATVVTTLHTPAQVIDAQNTASTTINQIIVPDLQTADSMQASCDTFSN